MAIGATFSALEVVPLVVLGYEAWEHWHLRNRAEWMARLEVATDVLCGSRVLEYARSRCVRVMINPPISLYYIQG